MKKVNPAASHFLLLAVTLLLVALGFVRLFEGDREALDKTEASYSSGSSLNLSADTRVSAFADFQVRFGYVKDTAEAAYLSGHVLRVLREGKELNSVNGLLGRDFAIRLDSARMAEVAAYPHLMDRIRFREEALGLCQEVDSAYATASPDCPSFEGKARKIRVMIREEGKRWKAVSSPVVLRVSEHWNETSRDRDGNTRCETRDSVYAYVMAVGGKTVLRLPTKGTDGAKRYFSIQPVKRGYEYGAPRGTYRNGIRPMVFKQRVLSISPFGRPVIRTIIDEGALTVRTPAQYRRILSTTVALFCLAWLVAFLLLALWYGRLRRRPSLWVLAVGAGLTGISLINLYSIPDPLSGPVYGWLQLLKGVLPGTALMLACALFDWEKWYARGLRRSLANTSRQGFYLVIAAVAIALFMAVAGTGPDGSGAKVNLPVGFRTVQTAPVVKALLILFFATFLANKEKLIQSFSTRMDHSARIRRMKLVSVVFFSVLAVICIQVLWLSDLGPSLCVVAVFLLAYSLVRRDLVPTFIGVASFLVLLLLARLVPGIHPAVVLLVWLVGWLVGCYFFRKSLYETAPMVVLLISAVIFGGDIMKKAGLEDAGARLENRVEMARSPFDNEAQGGDQIMHGQWAIANGSMFGKVGEANGAAYIPAAHTDMVLCSVAESCGSLTVIMVLLLLAALVYESLQGGIRNGHPFSFFLSMLTGLGVVGQALVIALGSVGAIPLTGVVFPYLAYGSSDLWIQYMALGTILQISAKEDRVLYELNTRRYMLPCNLLTMAVGILLLVVEYKVMDAAVFHARKYSAMHAVVTNKQGKRIIQYNPRIRKVEQQLLSADIVDRNGLPLATSDPDRVMADSTLGRYEAMGIDREDILSQVRGGRRIYPLGPLALFLTGDTNRKLLWGGTGSVPAGLLGDELFDSELRGFDTRPQKTEVVSTWHHSPYLPDEPVSEHDSSIVYDYSDLVILMRHPALVKEWNGQRHGRDVRLTVDAVLQSLIETKTETFMDEQREGNGGVTDMTRVPTVILDGSNGELIASPVYPLPDPDLLEALAESKVYVYRDDIRAGFQAYSDRDLGMTHPTPPGSTEKTVTAGAGLVRFGPSFGDESYALMVYKDEIVDTSLGEPTGLVTLEKAIAGSSNVAFIKWAAEHNLYPEMGDIWWKVGMQIGKNVPYYLYPEKTLSSERAFKKEVAAIGRQASAAYKAYRKEGKRHRLIDGAYQEAWGQGRLSSTPLALARYLGAVGAGGVLMRPKYTLSDTTAVMDTLMSEESAKVLMDCMKAQAGNRFAEFTDEIGGKTGTPVRECRMGSDGLMNDAWYGFVFKGSNGHPYAVVTRLERVRATSSLAMEYTSSVLLPALRECGYL